MTTTHLDVALDTALFYQHHPRALRRTPSGKSVCSYLTDDGCACGVGRWLDAGHPYYDTAVEENSSIQDTLSRAARGPMLEGPPLRATEEAMQLFKPEVRHLSRVSFWLRVQRFHDDEAYWEQTEGGNQLTDSGRKALVGLVHLANHCDIRDGLSDN